jgi:hypothetical protein
MSITVVTAATSVRLCRVTDVLDEMPENVLLVERFVDQASAAIERYCQRVFAQQAYREIRLPEHSRSLMLHRLPIVSVSLVELDDVAVTDYRIESAEAGQLYRQLGWAGNWQTSEWTIEYIAGYRLPEQTTPPDANGPALPGDVQRACIEAVKIWWAEKEISDRIASKTLGLTGDSISYRISAHQESLPPLAKHLLDPWRRMVLA